MRCRGVDLSASLACAVLATSCGADVTTFELRVVTERCLARAPAPTRIALRVLPINARGETCLLQEAEIGSQQPTTRLLDGGALEGAEEVVVAALAFGDDGCLRCHALVRALLSAELTRYDLELTPTTACALPEEVPAGLDLAPDALDVARCPR